MSRHAAKALVIVLVSFVVLSAAPPKTATVQPKPALSEPSISPDGSQIAFVSGGDIWTVPASGGEARLLVANPAAESRPLYSPDGKYLAFTSTRTGNGDVYVLTLATGDLARLTYDDATEPVEGWSPDSHYIYFSSNSHDISGMNDIYRVSVEGGTPMPVTADRYVNEFFSAPSPDGKTVAFSAHGIANGQWWRHGRSHLDESEIWTVTDGAEPKYTKLVDAGAKDLWPMWSADGGTLYFMSDRSGAENIWSLANKQRKQITQFNDGRVLWPSIARNGRTIVFERNFGIWKLDLASGKAFEVPIHLVGAPDSAGVEHEKFTDRISEFALSPDAKKVVFAVHGELFAASAKDGGDGIRLTHTEAHESQVAWSPDSRRVVYVSDRDGLDHIFLYDFGKDAETQLTHDNGNEESPRWSPDGKLLAFLRNRDELVVFNVADKSESVVATAPQGRWPGAREERDFDWSPDSKLLAFLSYGDRMFRNASVVPASGGGKAQPASFLANVSGDTISWSPDGKYLLIETNQRTENGVVARIDLVPHTPSFREDQFRDLFKEQKPPVIERTSAPEQKPAETEAPKDADKPKDAKEPEVKPEDKKGPAARPTKVVFEGIRDRLSILPVGVDVGWQTISPDGKWLAVIADAAGEQNIYVYSLDELAKEPAVAKQLTATPGRKSDVQFTPDSKEIYYLDRGKINSVTLETPKPKPIAVTAEMDVDFSQEKVEVFNEAWRYLQQGFVDSKMNGANWQAVHDEMEPYAEGARSSDDLRRVIALMIGELNSSHSGVGAPMEERKTSTGRLGLRFDRAEYERSGKLKVSEVVDLGPASVAGIQIGDFLTAVEGTAIGPHTNVDALLDYTIGKRTALTVESGGATKTVVLKPVNLTTEKGLLYRQWVEGRRAYVERVSHGELGYVHMADMSDRALTQLTIDLDVQNYGRKGVVVDVRNNNGGFVNAYALDVLARRPYLNMTFRGFDKAVPARTILGQRSLELPTVLVTNQHSLSDAEDFTEGYRALGLGKVVGEPTAGWIIYTGGVTLIDGTTVRMPHIRVTDHEGKPMEMHPRPVDFAVENPVGESYTGKDSQLDEAIRVLLEQVEGTKTKVAE